MLNADSLTALGTILAIPLLALLVFLIAWEIKIKPTQNAMGKPCLPAQKLLTFTLQSIATDKPTHNPTEEKPKLAIDWRIIYPILYLAYTAIAFAWWEEYIWWEWYITIPAIIAPLLIIIARVRTRISTRISEINKLFDVVNPKMSYTRADRNAVLHPWDFVNDLEFTPEGEPSKIHIHVPTTFSAGNAEAKSTFEREFSVMMTDPLVAEWKFDWKPEKRQVIAQRVAPLPTGVDYQGSKDYPWSKIPFGVSQEGTEVWDLEETPQGMALGLTGSGKSVWQRSIICHVMQHSDEMVLYGIDLKMVELPLWVGYPGIKEAAITLQEAHSIIDRVETEMKNRFAEMSRMGVKHADDLPGKMPAIIMMIDESAELMMMSGGKSPEEKEDDAMRGTIRYKVNSIAQLGRAAKVHLITCTQRANVDAIGGGTAKSNYGFRVLLGNAKKTESLMALDSMDGTYTPGIKGRGIANRNGANTPFQAYWIPPEWPEKNGYSKTDSPDNTPTSSLGAEYESEDDLIAALNQMSETPRTAKEAGLSPIVEDTDDGIIEYGDFGFTDAYDWEQEEYENNK